VVLPEYTAVIEWLPVASEVVVHVAMPLASVAALQLAIDVAPSRKFTVPVGTPADPEAVAVKVTLCPGVEGFADEASAREGFNLTDWLNAADVVEPYVLSPE
jgi:hypothetical protein